MIQYFATIKLAWVNIAYMIEPFIMFAQENKMGMDT